MKRETAWLTRGMRGVSRHSFLVDGQVEPKVLIYPRMDLVVINEKGKQA